MNHNLLNESYKLPSTNRISGLIFSLNVVTEEMPTFLVPKIFKKNMEQNQINGLIFSLKVVTEQMPIFFNKCKSLLISSIPETAGYIVQKTVVAATV